MPQRHASEAVVLAAGNGLRLAGASSLPKPLIPVRDRPLLDYIVATVASTSLHRLHIVIGHRGDDIRRHMAAVPRGIEINWIENPRYQRPNGLSLLAAAGHVQPPFVLLMADHLFEARTLAHLVEQAPGHGGLLAVDRRVDHVFDLDDATKVSIGEDGAITALGKRLARYDAVDTGMFLLDGSIFEAMASSADAGDESLTGGANVLARRGLLRGCSIGNAHWIDVDTPQALAHAHRLAAHGVFG